MAKIIAKTIEGKEFMYSRTASYSVSNAGADAICKTLNDIRWGLREIGEKWHVYDVATWELDYMNAGYEQFTRRKGKIMLGRRNACAL